MNITVNKKFLLLPVFLTIAAIAYGGNIVGIKLGSHPQYTLLIVDCDREMRHIVDMNGAEITIAFPIGTELKIPRTELNRLNDAIIKRIEYNHSTGELIIKVKKNYDLKSYINRRPYQLVLDFSHRPGKPPAARIKSDQAVGDSKTKPLPPKPTVRESIESDSTQKAEIQEPTIQSDSTVFVREEFTEMVGGPLPANELFLRGMELRDKGEYEAALEAFLGAVPAVRARAHYQAALMYEKLHKPKKAVKELSLAIVDDPSALIPRIKLGMVYQSIGQNKKAEKIWEELLGVLPKDTLVNFNQMSYQVELLESLLNSEGLSLSAAPPPIDNEKLPGFPWKWVLIALGVVATLVFAKVISNWRMNRLLKSAVADEEEDVADEQEYSPAKDAQASIKQSLEEEKPEDDLQAEKIDDLMNELESMGISTEGLNDEKQQKIYELSKQGYSNTEIAKMLDMGQEEVKFILDFRTKTEDGTISLGK